jgi:thiol-disulfide isomerase/thioredoxin
MGLPRIFVLALMLARFDALAAGGAAQPRPGDVPPADLGRTLDGTPVNLADRRGKVVVLTFWASWCGPCRKELPVLGRLQQAVGREHLEVIAVNVKEPHRDLTAVLRANRDLDLTWVHDARGDVSGRYGVEALPNMFVMDRDGTVAYVHRGYSEAMIKSFIDEIIGLLPEEVLESPAPAAATR